MSQAYYSSVDGTKTARGVNYHGTNSSSYSVRNTSLLCQQLLSISRKVLTFFPFQVHLKTQ